MKGVRVIGKDLAVYSVMASTLLGISQFIYSVMG